jgi:hypothetical protein
MAARAGQNVRYFDISTAISKSTSRLSIGISAERGVLSTLMPIRTN